MGLLSDIQFDPRETLRDPRASTGLADEFGKGLRSGLTGTGAGLRALAGTAGEYLGADEFAKDQFIAARRLKAQAESEAPLVSSYKQVDDLRSGAQYVSGLLGGSAPSMAAGVGAGMFAKTALGALGASTLAQAPIEAGDVAMKQMEDPEAMAMSAGERGLRQLGGGLGSAALQSIVPAAISGKLLGRGAEQAAKQSVGRVIGGAAMNIPSEGFFEGASDALKQTASNENKALDWESIKENTIGGAAAGGAMGTVGAAADLAYRNGPMVRDAVSSGLTSIKDKVEGIKSSPAARKGKDFFDTVNDTVAKGKTKAEDVAGKIMRGEELGIDPAELATASMERVKEMFDFSDNAKAQAAFKFGKEMMEEKFGLDEAKRAEVAQHMENFKDSASQKALAGIYAGVVASQKAGAKISQFTDAVRGMLTPKAGEDTTAETADNNAAWANNTDVIDVEGRFVNEPQPLLKNGAQVAPKMSMRERKAAFIQGAVEKGATPEDAQIMWLEELTTKRKVSDQQVQGDAADSLINAAMNKYKKKSEDYSGVEQVIADTLRESGFFERHADLMADDKGIGQLAGGLRAFLDEMTIGKVNPKAIDEVTKLLGEDAPFVFNSLKNAVYSDLGPKEAEMYFRNLNEIDSVTKRTSGAKKTLDNLMDEPLDAEKLDNLFYIFTQHASGEHANKNDPPAKVAATDRQVAALYQMHFGSKSDAARKAVEAHVSAATARSPGLAEERSVGTSALDSEDGSMESATDAAANPDADMAASNPMGESRTFNQFGDVVEPEDQEVQYFGHSKPDALGRMGVERGGTMVMGGSEAAEKMIKKVKGFFPSTDAGPTHHVFYEQDKNDPLRGRIVAEKLGPPGEFNNDDLDAVKFDMDVAGAASKSPSRFKVGGKPFDAVRLANHMLKRGDSSKFEIEGVKFNYQQRVVDAFTNGVAKLAVQLDGDVDIAPTTVIGYVDGKPLTWGAAQKVRRNTVKAEDLSKDRPIDVAVGEEGPNRLEASFPASHEGMADLRDMHAAMFLSDEKLVELGLTRVPLPPGVERDAAKKIMLRARKQLTEAMDRKVSLEQAPDERTDAQKYADAQRDYRTTSVTGDTRPLTYGEAQAQLEMAPLERRDSAYSEGGDLTKMGATETLAGGYVGGRTVGEKQNEVAASEIDNVWSKPRPEGQKAAQYANPNLQYEVRSRESVESSGQREAETDGNIHMAQAHAGKEDIGRPANMDGSSKYTPRGRSANTNGFIAAVEGWDTSSAGAAKVKEQAQHLLANAHSISAKDLQKLADLDPAEAGYKPVRYNEQGDAHNSLTNVLHLMGSTQVTREVDGRLGRIEKAQKELDALPPPENAVEEKQYYGIQKYIRLLRHEVGLLRKRGESIAAGKEGLTPGQAAAVVNELFEKYKHLQKLPSTKPPGGSTPAKRVARSEANKERLGAINAGVKYTPSNERTASNAEVEKRDRFEQKSGTSLPPVQNKKDTALFPGVELTEGNAKFLEKDNVKSKRATKFIGRGSETSSTQKYARQWGKRANSGAYTADDVVFVSAEGVRNARIAPDAVEIGKAMKAGAVILTDSEDSGRLRGHNVGEREVATMLAKGGYAEISPGEWAPALGGSPRPKAQAPAKGAVRFGDKAAKPEAEVEISGLRWGEQAIVDIANSGEKGGREIMVPTANQRRLIRASIGRIHSQLGFLLDDRVLGGIHFVAHTGVGRGAYRTRHKSNVSVISVNFSELLADDNWADGFTIPQRMDWVLSHELGHVLDKAMGVRLRELGVKVDTGFVTELDDSFHPGGEVYDDSAEGRKAHNVFDWAFAYPMDKIGFDVPELKIGTSSKARELFAQYVALHVHNKELLNEHFPEAGEVIRTFIERPDFVFNALAGALDLEPKDGDTIGSRGANREAVHATGHGPGRLAALVLDERTRGPATSGGPQNEHSVVDVVDKKQAAIRLAKSNDQKLLDDIEAATDAKQLQRLIAHLADHAPETQAMTRAIERLKEMIQSDESIGYGLQTRKYSLESTKGESDESGDKASKQRLPAHGFTRSIRKYEGAFEDGFRKDGIGVREEETSAVRPDVGSFGDTKNCYAYINESADGTIYSTLISHEMLPILQKVIDRLAKEGAAEDEYLQAVEGHALQQAYYDPADGTVGTVGPTYGTPAFEFHNARGHLHDSGQYWVGQEGTPEGRIYQVKNTSRDQIAKLFATVTAFHKAMGKEGATPKWVRESGAKPGKTGGTKKYSLESTNIHNDLGREGFAATHDSPVRHEGVFDWREHQGKGEGNASFGAGTYLSTANGVHKSYKNQFTAVVEGGESFGATSSIQTLENDIAGFEEKLAALRDTKGEYVAKYSPADKYDGFASLEEANREVAKWVARKTRMAEEHGQALSPYYNLSTLVKSKSQLMEQLETALASTKQALQHGRSDLKRISPTYHVSVNIKDEQLMDWDKPLSEQSELVREALKGIASIDWMTVPLPNRVVFVGRGMLGKSPVIHGQPDGSFLVLWDDNSKTFSSAAEAKSFAVEARSGMSLYGSLAYKLDSQAKASDYLQSLGILGHKYAASGGRNDEHPNFVIYDDSKITTNYVHFDKSGTNTATNNYASAHADIDTYIKKVLSTSVQLAWGKFSHAGDYTHALGKGIIRLSVHALNPMSTAHHEALHAFVAQLRDAGAHDVVDVLYKSASSELVMKQLKEKYKNQPAVLEQLRKDPEERVAYMYQMWAADPKAFKVAISAKNVLGRLKQLVLDVLGIWSNDTRALHIMDYFHAGEYAKNIGKPNAVHAALIEANTNKTFEKLKSLTEPLAKLADAILSTGDARVRDTNVPAFMEMADLIKRKNTEEGGDQGFIAASRIQSTTRLNELMDRLAPFSKEQLDLALEAMQAETIPADADVQKAVDVVRDVLAKTRNYMVRSGTDVGHLGPNYFPRVWNVHHISKNEQAFRDMLQPYIDSGEFTGNPTDLIRNMVTRDGDELSTVAKMPGMQHKKTRTLSFLKAEDVAPFLVKDLNGILVSYITQAARRAEWDRRFGWDRAKKVNKMQELFARARDEGATDEQVKLANTYILGVDGTLGDDLDPGARRLMGNVMVYQNIRLLPLAVFSMAVDPLGVMVRGGTVTDAFNTFKTGMKSIYRTFKPATVRDEAEQLAETLGVIDSAILSNTMGDVYTQGMVGGAAKAINQTFFKYNFVEGMNRAFRTGATQAAIAFIKRNAGVGSSPHSKRWMAELGLQSGDIKVLASGKIALSTNDGLSVAQAGRVRAAVNQWVDGAVQRPDAADKPIWMNDPHWSLIAHLKQFVYSFQETILKRVAHEFEQGNYAPAMALSSYVPLMIAVDTAKGLLQNGGDVPEWKKDWGAWEYTNYGVERAGLYGVSQFGNDIMSDVGQGGTGFGALSGPTLEQLSDVVQSIGGRKEFSGTVIDALPANALYKEAVTM